MKVPVRNHPEWLEQRAPNLLVFIRSILFSDEVRVRRGIGRRLLAGTYVRHESKHSQ